MKILILATLLLALPQPTLCGKLPSKWQVIKLITESPWSTPVAILGTILTGGAAVALVDVNATACGVALLGYSYCFYTAIVSGDRKPASLAVGSLVLLRDADGLSKATIGEVSFEGFNFKNIEGDIVPTEDVVAYEIFDHTDLEKQILVNDTENGYIEGRIEKVFTDGFYEVLTVNGNDSFIARRDTQTGKFVLVEY